MLEWKPIEEAPPFEVVMARNDEFGPYEYETSRIVFMDPPPTEFVTMDEWNLQKDPTND